MKRASQSLINISIYIQVPDLPPVNETTSSFQLPSSRTLLDLKNMVAEQIQGKISAHTREKIFKSSLQFALYDAELSGDDKTLEQLGLKDEDLVVLNLPDLVERQRLNIRDDAAARQQILRMRPALAQAIEDPVRFRETWERMEQEQQSQQEQRYAERERRAAAQDDFDIDGQAAIFEEIRQQAVQENLQLAYEHHPEGESSFSAHDESQF